MKKRTIKRIISSIGAVMFAFVLISSTKMGVNAVECVHMEMENVPSAPEDFGEPISVTTYVAEDGHTVTERVYFYSDNGSNLLRDKSGSGWYRNEKSEEWKSGNKTTYFAQGYFEWGDGKVIVAWPTGGASEVNGITISNENTESGIGKYGLVFNEYAYVTYSCTATSMWGKSTNLSVTIRVSESGNTI